VLGTAELLTPGGEKRGRVRRCAALAVATVLVVAVAVALRVQVARGQARTFYPPERVTAASRGEPADFLEYRWWLAGVRQQRQVFLPRGLVHVTMTVRVQPLTRAAVAKAAADPTLGAGYEFRHPDGVVWPAGRPRGLLSYELNRSTQFTVEGDVPEAVAGALGLQVKVARFTQAGPEPAPQPGGRRRAPDPVLRLGR
jgi:hypothetical protein